MQKIIPFLWYDKDAVTAAQWYVSLFENSEIINVSNIKGDPSTKIETIDFRIENLVFSAISAGPYFKLNPSISLMVCCSQVNEVDRLYNELINDGKELMPLGEYPFSKRYAWIEDKYGLNWQLYKDEEIKKGIIIKPNFLFAGEVCGKAEEALDYYVSVFNNASKGYINKYREGEAADSRAKINYGELNLDNLKCIMMDHGYGSNEKFNEAFSFMILCDNQEELDYYWSKLSHDKESEQCGWVKDKFGVSWQIIPKNIRERFVEGSDEEIARLRELKKINFSDIECSN